MGEIIRELKKIRKTEDLKLIIKKHKSELKKAALPVIVFAAVLVFWISGKSGPADGPDNLANGDIIGQNQTGISRELENVRSENSENYSGDSSNVYFEGNNGVPSVVYVDLSGAVINAGVYKADSNTRLFQIVQMAGGLTDDADTSGINQAEKVFDGEKIIIPSSNPDSPYYIGNINPGSDNSGADSITGNGNASGIYTNSGSGGTNNIGNAQNGQTNGTGGLSGEMNPGGEPKININTANETGLQSIPGIGPAKAQKILEYRDSAGYFSSVEDLMNVDGIGKATFESIRDYVTVVG